MQVGVIGINHKSAQLQFREIFAKFCQKRFGASQVVYDEMTYLLLSTCNRTEIYFSSNDLAATHSLFLRIMRQDIQEEFEHQLYTYFGNECFLHLARVTSGMDSALLFETEIQGQVKHAYELGLSLRPLASELHFMFQKCLKIGKEIRSSYPFIQNIPNFEETILQLADQFLGNLQNKKILFVGASEINCKIYQFFKSKMRYNITFCNRSKQRLHMLDDNEFSILPWDNIEKWIEFDLILFATKSPEYLIKNAPDLKESKLIIDLSVPRNVHPQLAKHSGICLLNVDQLNGLINRKIAMKAKELAYIEKKFLVESVKKQTSIYLQKEQLRQNWLTKAVS